MKCPSCKASFSDLRDLCPGCLVDVRPHKEMLGIKITYPGIGYSELIQRLEKRAYLSKLTLQRHAPVEARTNPQTAEKYEDEVLSLFEGSYQNLKSLGERSFEVTVEQLQTMVNPEEVRLLYDLLLESLEEPEKVQEYVEQVVTSDKVVVEAQELTKELENFERVTEVPVFSLKGTGLRARSDSDITQVTLSSIEESTREPLSFFQRLSVFLIDFSLVFALSFMSALLITHNSPDAIGAASFRELIVLHGIVISLTVALCGPVGMFYYAVRKIMLRDTLGGYLVR